MDNLLSSCGATDAQDRARALPLLCNRIEELKQMLNLGKEAQAFAWFKQFAEARLIEPALAARHAAAVVVALEDPEAYGNVQLRRLACSYLFERSADIPAPQENPR